MFLMNIRLVVLIELVLMKTGCVMRLSRGLMSYHRGKFRTDPMTRSEHSGLFRRVSLLEKSDIFLLQVSDF